MKVRQDDVTHTPTLREAARDTIRMLGFIRPYWPRLAKGLGVSLIISVLGLVAPMLSKLYFDEVLPARDYIFLQVLVIAVFLQGATSAMLNVVGGYFSQVLSAKINTEFRLRFFDRLQRMPASFYDSRRTGEILSRSSDLSRSLAFVTGLFQTLFVNGAFILVVPPVLFALSWQLALLSLSALPITTFASLLTGRVIRARTKRTMELNAEANGFSFETLSNARLVKTLAVENEMLASMRKLVVGAQRQQLEGAAVSSGLAVANAMLRLTSTAAFSWVAWGKILEGELTVGSFIAFSAYVGYLTGPIGQIAGLFTTLQDAAVSLGRFFEYFDQSIETDMPEEARVTLISGPATIAMHDVHFGYAPNEWILKGCNLNAGPGGVHAIVGPSGIGKSTIARLLMRLYSPSHGSILVDGHSIERYSLRDLRRRCGAVWQETGVMRGSIRENLLLGIDSASTSEIADVIEACGMTDFVSALPEGIDTLIGESGSTLSGGQRQRLALARALLRRPRLLILDEATSHLDPPIEASILERVYGLRATTTIVLITHRLLSVVEADRVYVVEDGSLSGGVPHAELLKVNSEYQRLWQATGRTDQDSSPFGERMRIRHAI